MTTRNTPGLYAPIEASLERIVDALEILAGIRPPVVFDAGEPGAPQSEAEPQRADGKKDKGKVGPGKASAVAEAPVVKTPTKEDVREALKAAQRATGPAGAKKILSDFKVKTLSDLPAENYGKVIAAAVKLVAAAEEGE